jgi:MOSC domain-containing protein YiiM
MRDAHHLDGQDGHLGAGTVASVNVGRPRTVTWLGRPVTSAIWKAPVGGRVAVRGVNLAGDDQADREAHGGPDKAVYAYATGDYALWRSELGRPLAPGGFGENLTVADLDVSGAVVGERWRVGGSLLEVSQPRIPCYKLGMRFGDAAFPRRFAAAGRPGAYLRIVEAGEVGAGDPVRVVHRPGHGVTVGTVARAYNTDHSLVPALLDVPELSASWRRWAADFLRKAEQHRRRGRG